ncbi:MAG: hypothetical protein IOC82_13640 [Aestuariivirga sp.]|uniref:GAP family protein n=1 Tax=Aestuariivirga sp. TaxID=2650926 RepID=UPI0025B7C33A|nr:GAP family protein [Aestuariivirga sp.]MCA3562061.1 hypothetical protein [Aestuariivirga sp.]
MWPILAFLGLAITDAMNPFTVAAMAVLLALDRPVARGAIFASVTFIFYLGFAIALAEGLTAVMARWLPLLPAWMPGLLLAILALLSIGFAAYFWLERSAADASVRLAKEMSLPGTAVFAAFSTISDAPTALPLFAAVAQLPLLTEARIGQYLWLTLYSAIYVAPLLLLLALRIMLASHMEGALNSVLAAVNWSFRHLLPPTLAIAGAAAGWFAAQSLRTLY